MNQNQQQTQQPSQGLSNNQINGNTFQWIFLTIFGLIWLVLISFRPDWARDFVGNMRDRAENTWERVLDVYPTITRWVQILAAVFFGLLLTVILAGLSGHAIIASMLLLLACFCVMLIVWILSPVSNLVSFFSFDPIGFIPRTLASLTVWFLLICILLPLFPMHLDWHWKLYAACIPLALMFSAVVYSRGDAMPRWSGWIAIILASTAIIARSAFFKIDSDLWPERITSQETKGYTVKDDGTLDIVVIPRDTQVIEIRNENIRPHKAPPEIAREIEGYPIFVQLPNDERVWICERYTDIVKRKHKEKDHDLLAQSKGVVTSAEQNMEKEKYNRQAESINVRAYLNRDAQLVNTNGELLPIKHKQGSEWHGIEKITEIKFPDVFEKIPSKIIWRVRSVDLKHEGFIDGGDLDWFTNTKKGREKAYNKLMGIKTAKKPEKKPGLVARAKEAILGSSSPQSPTKKDMGAGEGQVRRPRYLSFGGFRFRIADNMRQEPYIQKGERMFICLRPIPARSNVLVDWEDGCRPNYPSRWRWGIKDPNSLDVLEKAFLIGSKEKIIYNGQAFVYNTSFNKDKNHALKKLPMILQIN